MLAKIFALPFGLQLAWDSGCRKVEVDMDSLATIHLISGSPAANARYSSLLLQIHGLLKRSWQVASSHCYREANRVADVLVNLVVTIADHYQLL
ncbi:hypothetical protein P3X46_002836 [Hevea brasiliensis]|uniref:RNase H type-1 domain-containing protein n=1 Tax=Hevea brasiliensis TaxID=3981 RepID=A0ABQ9N823_HEVBR|nr:hypothetical protein P3X46_002836 [Hevea brasiliensis]